MNQEDILKFAQKQGYEQIQYLEKWRDYDVYEPMFNYDGISYIGLPLVILVKNNEIRMSTPEESFERIDDMND